MPGGFGTQQVGTGLFFRFEVEGEKQVEAMIPAVIARINDMSPLGETIDQIIADSVGVMFENEGAGRSEWPALALTTQADRVLHGFPPDHPILVRTGRLRDSFTMLRDSEHIREYARDYIEVGSLVPYAIYHQSPESRDTLPRRPMVYIDNRDVNRIVQSMRKYIGDGKATQTELPMD